MRLLFVQITLRILLMSLILLCKNCCGIKLFYMSLRHSVG